LESLLKNWYNGKTIQALQGKLTRHSTKKITQRLARSISELPDKKSKLTSFNRSTDQSKIYNLPLDKRVHNWAKAVVWEENTRNDLLAYMANTKVPDNRYVHDTLLSINTKRAELKNLAISIMYEKSSLDECGNLLPLNAFQLCQKMSCYSSSRAFFGFNLISYQDILELKPTNTQQDIKGIAENPYYMDFARHDIFQDDPDHKFAKQLDMKGKDLRGIELPRDLSGAKFEKCIFSRKNLTNISFKATTLINCDFTRSNLTNTSWSGDIVGCDFRLATNTEKLLTSLTEEQKRANIFGKPVVKAEVISQVVKAEVISQLESSSTPRR
jgi:hypothetical protein